MSTADFLVNSANSDLEFAAACYICMESTLPLEHSPCGCKGTCGMVHALCLTQWRASFRQTDDRHTKCMQCGHSYTNTVDMALPNVVETESLVIDRLDPLDPLDPLDRLDRLDRLDPRAIFQYTCLALAVFIRFATTACLLMALSVTLDQAFAICLVDHHCRVVWLSVINVFAAFLTESYQRRNLFICNAPVVFIFPDELVFFGCVTTSIVLYSEI